MKEASFYIAKSKTEVRCEVCPHYCLISEDKPGKCKVRTFGNGKLIAETYGRLSAVATDPIEKKPLYHFYPSRLILSVGSVGCNFECANCQNENISQCLRIIPEHLEYYSPKAIVDRALEFTPPLLAFTYNEPTVNYEYVKDVSRLAKEQGVECVMVTNGYINRGPLEALIPSISAFNVDLKSYDNKFYREITGGTLKPVMNSIDLIRKNEKHLEITYLVIPGKNDNPDSFRKLVADLARNYGKSTILHISRYFPRYKMNINPTPLATVSKLVQIAKSELSYVYPGNTTLEEESNTYCPKCEKLVIERYHYISRMTGLAGDRCSSCNHMIYGKFRKENT